MNNIAEPFFDAQDNLLLIKMDAFVSVELTTRKNWRGKYKLEIALENGKIHTAYYKDINKAVQCYHNTLDALRKHFE